MEVVSPPLFGRNQGAKRRFGSPIGGTATSEDFDMQDDCSSFQQTTKRRKRFSNDTTAGGGLKGGNPFGFQTKENWSISPFVQAPSTSCSSPLHGTASSTVTGLKRSRQSHQHQHGGDDDHDVVSSQKIDELQRVVHTQSTEIERLKSEHSSLQASTSQLSSQHAKVEHENKILKRAVTIQQERGNQMISELENARQYKVEAEERIRRLEQMNLTLQYQLQNSSSMGNDYMRFSPRPPDVF